MIIKVNGLRDGENIRQATGMGVDWIGMIFQKESPYNIDMISTHAGIIPDKAPNAPCELKEAKRVGIFLDEMGQNIITRVVKFNLDIIQLNGNETPTFIRNLRATIDPDLHAGISIMKTISINSEADIAQYHEYEDTVDYFLFDITGASNSEDPFDWHLLDSYDGQKPYLVSGAFTTADITKTAHFIENNEGESHSGKCIGIDFNTYL